MTMFTALAPAMALGACAPNYQQLRHEGQTAMLEGEWGSARILLNHAESRRHRRVENLHDMGVCSMMLAKAKLEQMNYPAALREVDAAIDYYSRAINELPGHMASLEGKNIALETKGRFEEALRHTHWAVEFVGPSARQYLFLAQELEERGDVDGAYLRYRQAISVEPGHAPAHRAMAKFLIDRHRDDAAMPYLEMAYRLDPKDAWVADQLAVRGMLGQREASNLATQ